MIAGSPISPRIRAAIALLRPLPGERLLEIGCGTGQGVQAVLEAQPTAQIVGIDRSDTAVKRAQIVNRAAIDDGRVAIHNADIERSSVEPGDFDRVFGIRVNSFWTKPGVALPHVAASLRRGGALWAIYDGPAAKVSEPLLASLEATGWTDIHTVAVEGAFATVASRP